MAKKTRVLTKNELIMKVMDMSEQTFSLKEYKDFIKKSYSINVVENGETYVEGYRSIFKIEDCFTAIDFCDSVLLKFAGDLASLNVKDLSRYKWIVEHSEKICNAMMNNFDRNLNNEKFMSYVREYKVAKIASDNIKKLSKMKNDIHLMNKLNKSKDYKLSGLTYSDCEQMLADQKAVLAEHPYTTQVKFAGIYHQGVCDNKNRLEKYVLNLNSVKIQVREVENSKKNTKTK